jgi:hypothetical protein
VKNCQVQGERAHIYRHVLGLGFEMGQMGWIGLAQNTQTGCANLFSGIKMFLRNSSLLRNRAKRVRTNGRLRD